MAPASTPPGALDFQAQGCQAGALPVAAPGALFQAPQTPQEAPLVHEHALLYLRFEAGHDAGRHARGAPLPHHIQPDKFRLFERLR
jgi:hypothetical protein